MTARETFACPQRHNGIWKMRSHIKQFEPNLILFFYLRSTGLHFMTLYRVQLGSAAEGHGNMSEWYGFLAGFSNLTFQRRYLRLRGEEEMPSSAGLHHVCGHLQKLCSEPHTKLLFSFEQCRLPLGPVTDTLFNTKKKKLLLMG